MIRAFKWFLSVVSVLVVLETIMYTMSVVDLSLYQGRHKQAISLIPLFERKFASIRTGETKKEVEELLGKPNNTELISRPITMSDNRGELLTYVCPGRLPNDQHSCKGTVLLGSDGQVIDKNIVYPETLEPIR